MNRIELDAAARPVPKDRAIATYDQTLATLVGAVHVLGADFIVKPEVLLAALNTIRLEQEVVSQEHTRDQIRLVKDRILSQQANERPEIQDV